MFNFFFLIPLSGHPLHENINVQYQSYVATDYRQPFYSTRYSFLDDFLIIVIIIPQLLFHKVTVFTNVLFSKITTSTSLNVQKHALDVYSSSKVNKQRT